MKYYKTACLLLLLVFVQTVTAQKTITLEKIRCFSTTGPVMNYWRSEEVKKTFISDLKASLLKQQNLTLIDSAKLPVELLTTGNGAVSEKITYSDTDTSHLHLYLDIFELDLTNFMFLARNGIPDTSQQQKLVCMIVCRAHILNSQKMSVFFEEIHVAVTRGESVGIGVEYNGNSGYGKLPGSSKSFTSLLNKTLGILLDPQNKLELVEMKVPPAYVADNYILGKTLDRPRIFVNMKKGISEYNYLGNAEMIRMDDPLYEQIVTKGKRARVYPKIVMDAIQHAKNNEGSDFVFLRQDCRDVIRNKNYLLKLLVQIDPDFISSGPKTVFSNFLEEKIHYLLNEKDTLAAFTIRKNVLNTEGRKLFLNQVSNGIDTGSIFQMDTRRSEWVIRYNYVISGTIGGKDFGILFAGSTNRLKELILDGKTICLAEGGNAPGKFILFDTSVSPELLNQLFIIAFNGFFE